MAEPTIVWLRDDLRIADNPALTAGAARDAPLVVLWILDDAQDRPVRAPGAASRWWLHGSLARLGAALDALGGRLVLRRGAAEQIVPSLVAELGAGAVYWNRRYGRAREVDAEIKEQLRADGLEVTSFAANLLVEPWELLNGAGQPFQVFTPFWRALDRLPAPRAPLPAPTALPASPPDVASDALDDWALLPTSPDWAAGLRERWTPGEEAARAELERFVSDGVEDYDQRDAMAADATSHLSPYLSHGEVSPFTVWHEMRASGSAGAKANGSSFLREVAWREFNYHLLYREPELATVNHDRRFDRFPWGDPDAVELDAWRQGRTGFPLVDAGMRELWTTGYMHNRVRMVTASFLIKNMLVDWRLGEQWFWDTLVDADEANNPANWQWVAGSGADASPYFRVFNPEKQALDHDPAGRYVAQWVPEAGSMAYAAPILDLKSSRVDALAAFDTVKDGPRR